MASNTITIAVIGWFLIPVISFLVNKLLSSLDSNLQTKLEELELNVIPSLKKILEEVTEQRVLGATKDEGKRSEPDLKTLGELEKMLKFALYDADDVFDLVEYRRIEKEVISGDGKSVGTSISSWVLHVVGDCIACCKRSSFGQKLWQFAQNLNQKLRYLGEKLQQCALDLDQKFWDLVAKLQQCAQTLNMYNHQGATGQPPMPDVGDIEQILPTAGQTSMADAPAARSVAESRDDTQQGSASTSSPTPYDAPTNPALPNALLNSAGSATEFRGNNQHRSAEAPTLDATWNSLVQMICGWLMNGFSALRSLYLWARELRDSSYELVGIKNDDGTTTDWVLPINEIISLWKKIKDTEHTFSNSKNSPLLNKSSSSTPKNTDKESSTQKEIDDLYRNIEKKVFGRDKDREHISRMLRKGSDDDAASSSTSKPYSVIGISGITGSGKTTLAQYVCTDEKKAGHFNPIMFIHVGETFSVENIFRDMMEQITRTRPPTDEGLKSLKTKLEEKLKGKRFLLVLDDLWVNGENQTDILLDTLNVALSGSRVLVTAQKTDAAEALGAYLLPFSIPDLEEGVYLSLFMHYAGPFATDDDYRNYGRIGTKIAEKLRRSPIAAVTVGKQLRNKSISFWDRTAKLDVLNKTMGALSWSYQQLGVDIRLCFAYCSIFPKGYRLKRDELVHIWIAQGFVSTRCNAAEDLEDIGQSYFHQLLTFSFLQTNGLDGDYEEFTIHDLLHELAEKVSGSEFFRIGVNGSPEDIPLRVHHLFVETKKLAEINEKILDLGNLRTLIIHEDSYDSDSMITNVERTHDLERLLERLFMRLKKLRVLIIIVDFYTSKFSVPASIDHIKHLRYLAIPFPNGLFRLVLPSTFSKLYQIQTIDIPCVEASCPEDMANLVHLRHTSDSLCFPNIVRLTSLQTLKSFKVTEKQGYELNQLKHLNKLRGNLSIQGLRIVKRKEEALEANLAQKEGLRELELDFSWPKGNPDVVAEVLEGLCPPIHLEKLSIECYNGSRYPSWMLSRHYSETSPMHLKKLKLYDCSQLASIPEDSELFIGLCELVIYACDWDRLPQNMERLVSLQTLEIWKCKKMKLLGTLPHQSLETISIDDCGVLSKTCKEEGHTNWRKIQHIPNIFIL